MRPRSDVDRSICWLSKITRKLTWYEMEGPVRSKEPCCELLMIELLMIDQYLMPDT